MTIEIALVAFIGFMALIPLRWRQCVQIALVLLVFEGAIRKWILPGASELVYFGKDFLMLAAYLKYYRAKAEHEPFMLSSLMKFYLLVCGAIVLIQATNFALGSPLVGVVGARNYLLYIPLMFITRDLFSSQDELDRFLRRYLTLAIPVCALAVIQHLSPPDSPFNVYAWGNEKLGRAYVGDFVRVTGTFSYVAGYAAYLQTCAALVIPLLLIEHPFRWRWIFRIVIGCVLMGIMMTGSRGPIIMLGIFLAGYFILNRPLRKLQLYRKFVVPIVICAIPLLIWFSALLGAFSDRFSQNSDLTSRIVGTFTAPIDYVEYSGLFGYGSGATYQGTNALRRMFRLPPGEHIPVYYESEPERIVLELGPLGFIFWYALRIFLIICLWQTYRRLQYPLLRELALTAFLLHLITIPGQLVFQITFMVYYWFLAGFIFLLPRLERIEMERWEMEQAEAA